MGSLVGGRAMVGEIGGKANGKGVDCALAGYPMRVGIGVSDAV